MKATAVIKRPGEVKGLVKDPLSITANVSKLGGASVIVDPSLDPTSENPVENKAITEAIEEVRDSIDALDEAVHDLDDDKQDVLTFDSVPTVNSQNPVTSDGVYLGLQFVMGELQDNVTALSGQIDGKYDASNPNGYVNATQAANAAPVQSVNGQTGAVSLSIPTRTSDLTNNSGFITAAGAPVQSVNGATGNVTVTVPTKTSDLTNDSGFVNASGAASAAPVQSVNGQTGIVSLSIPTVPSNVSAFTNDAGYVTASTAPVRSVNGQTGVVTLSIPTVPSNVSAFTNDAGYLTLSTLPIYQGGVSP